MKLNDNLKRNTKYYNSFSLPIILSGLSLLLISCTNTPNSINITPTQGTCVQAGMYNPKLTPPAAITSNPASAPYCMGITIQNNNSGMNANNIQITNLGLTINYTVGKTPFNGILYDPVAAGISINGQSQNYGNVGIYDPRNCVTNQGASVTTLGTGQSCMFYLQLSGESNPVGIYPTNLTYNYTNGNQNYSISVALNQRVYLYGGAPSGLFYTSNLQPTTTNPVAWQTGLTPTVSPVPYIIEDGFGFVYFATANTVYIYSGANVASGNMASATQLGGTLPTPVSAIAFDTSYNVYAATASGIYVYNKSLATPAWMYLTDNSRQITDNTQIIGLKGFEFESPSINQLYAITGTTAYQCSNPNVNANGASCNWIALTTGPNIPTKFYQNAIDTDASSNLYASSNLGASQYSNGWKIPYGLNPALIPGSNISGVRWSGPIPPSFPNQTLYLGAMNAGGQNSVYNCIFTGSNACTSLISSKNNGVNGNANSVTTDGAGNVCVTGSGLNSPDFAGTSNTAGTCLMNISESTTSSWIPIQNGSLSSGQISYGTIASMLTY